jgi:hypothetical protein
MVRKFRSRVQGRLYLADGRAPNQPLAIICARAVWVRQGDSWILEPQSIHPQWCRLVNGSYSDACTAIADDIAIWRSSQRRQELPVVIGMDKSQAPYGVDVLTSTFTGTYDAAPQLAIFELVAGQSDGLHEPPKGRGSVRRVGARWLVSYFKGIVAAEEPTPDGAGLPVVEGKVVVNFNEFIDDGYPDSVSVEAVRQAFATTKDLFKGKPEDPEALLDLQADHVVAVAMMLLVLAAATHAPPAGYTPESVWGGDLDYSEMERAVT